MADVSAFAPVEEQKVVSHDNGVPESQPPHKMTVKEYCLTRFSTLKPPMHHAPNPFRLVMMLNGKQWLFFLVAFLAWVSLYFSVVLCVSMSRREILSNMNNYTLTFMIHSLGTPLTSSLCH